MSKWKLFGFACCLLGSVAFGMGHGHDPQAAPGQPRDTGGGKVVPLAKQEPGKGKRAQEFLAAFNKGDAKTVAGFWTLTGEYVDQEGKKYDGRPAIEKLYSRFFAENKGAKLNVTVSSARMVSPEVAIEEGTSEVTLPDGNPPSVAAFNAVLVKHNGDWYFESVRESIAHPPTNASHFEGIEWLLGDWTGEATKGESARASYRWAENRNFVVSSFDTTLNGIPVIGGTQWIVWDAVEKQIRSFTFYSGGGFGESRWTGDGDKWSVKLSARSARGETISATNVLTRLDNDHVSWQLTKLTIDGKPGPDMPAVKLVRLKADRK